MLPLVFCQVGVRGVCQCLCVREKLTRWRLSQQLNTDEELLLTHTLLSHHGQMSTQASLRLAGLNFLLRVLNWFVYLSLLMVTCWFNRFNCFHSGVGLRYVRFSACRWSALLLLFFITSDFARDSEGSPKSEQYVQECSMSKSEIPPVSSSLCQVRCLRPLGFKVGEKSSGPFLNVWKQKV